MKIMIRLFTVVALSALAVGEALQKANSFQTSIVQPTTTENDLLLRRSRHLRDYSDVLADGTETFYDEYAQAWRMLGLFVDCSDGNEREGRRVEEEDNMEQEEEDVDEEEGEEEENKGCKRYILWAAYVDLEYQGGGEGEYQIIDPQSRKWDSSNCIGDRCVKMDCHLPGTKFKLLGFFKEENPVDFMAILAENGGSCLWSSDEYNLMVDHVYGLPQGCTSSGVYADNQHQEQFYLDLKPKSAGGIDIGVYSDNRCSMEYSGGISTQKIWRKYVSNQAEAANNYNNGADNNYEDGAANDEDGDDDNSIQYSQTIEYKKIQSVNKALQAFQVCQPCLNCNSVNQCSMFAQNGISKASFQDIATARQQGAIQQTYIGGESWWTRNGFLLLSILVLLVGVTIFYFVFRKVNKRIGVDSKPLIADNR